MINMYEVSETNKMIESENLDVRTITLGISLLDCVDSDLDELNRKIYEKITTVAKDLVSTGKAAWRGRCCGVSHTLPAGSSPPPDEAQAAPFYVPRLFSSP